MLKTTRVCVSTWGRTPFQNAVFKVSLGIRAEVEDHAPAGYSPIYQEYQVGDFECEFTLSGDFDPDRIEAGLSEGVLRLTIPRAEQAAARTIKITAGG